MTAVRCINALNAAAGRELTEAELAQVFDKINRTARDLAAGRIEPEGTQNLSSPEGIVRAAAEIEAKALIAEKERGVANAYRSVKTLAARQADAAAIVGGKIGRLEAVRRLIANDADGRADVFSLESRALATSAMLKSRLQETWAALGNDFLGFFQDKAKVRDLISEMRGEDSGNPLAKKGAEVWRKTAEDARLWFNELGGKIGRLEDWGMPQHHSQELVARAGRDQWVADILPMIDRSKYLEIDGSPMTEPQIREFLGKAWDSIATNGANKIEPGKFKGSGSRANRGAEERQIHYKDAASVIDYWSKYGEKTLPEILLGHVEGIAKDIAFVEHFGPNPDATYRMLRDEAQAAQAAQAANLPDADKRVKAIAAVDREVSKLDRLYDYAAGKVKPVADRRIAKGFQMAQQLNAAGKLGSAFWASLFGDKVMFEAIGHVNNLPAFQRWYNETRLLNPANAQERRLLRRQGLMLDYMGNSMARFGEDLGQSAFAGKMATGVLRATGMAAVNEWRRGAWALTAMDSIGHVVQSKDFGAIGKNDARLLQSYGITEFDWKVWKLADLTDLGHGNKTALTPEAIAAIPDDKLRQAGLISQAGGPEEAAGVRRDAVVKFLGALTSESNLAVIEPGWNDRARMYGGLQRGNLRDEITRSFWQFKAFPIAQFERMLDVGLSRPTTGGKAAMLAAFPVMGTLMGAMMLQTQDLLSGKDPRPMADWKFWAAAAMKGGSLGLYGDFLYSQSATTRYGTGPLEALAGPTIGAAADLTKFAVQAANTAASDPESWPRAAARGLNIAKGFVPGQNMWMTKWATDHLIFQTAQEFLNPGYLSSMQDRTMKEFGQEWWLPPGNSFSDMRAPDWSRALESGP